MNARPAITPRILTKEDAMLYVDCRSSNAFSTYLKKIGVKPLPHRNGCYDRVAIDAALDRFSGITKTEPKSEAERWLEENGDD